MYLIKVENISSSSKPTINDTKRPRDKNPNRKKKVVQEKHIRDDNAKNDDNEETQPSLDTYANNDLNIARINENSVYIIESKTDDELTELYNNDYNNDLILGNAISYNYLNITSPINTNLINKPTNSSLTEIFNYNDKIGGTYQYAFTYVNKTTNEESIISNISTITVSNNSVVNIKLYYINEQYVNIYRTNYNSNILMFLTQLDLHSQTSYVDILDSL